jgi:hypothetical protein
MLRKSCAINKKGESVKMNKAKMVFVLVLIAAVVSLGLTGCKNEHPSGEHPSSEHPSKKTPSEEHPSEEHPSGEHPK